MKNNKLLSFTIPTFNRADLLDECLAEHVPIAKKYEISIYITDNCSTDNTYDVVKKWKSEYSSIEYFKNNENIGPDANFQKALEYPNSKYIWLLGDSYKLPLQGIEFLMNYLENNEQHFDMIVFNLNNNINIKSQTYTDKNNLLNDLGALMSCISTLVFSKKLIENANFDKYFDTNYIQTGIIFEYFTKNSCTVKWIEEYLISDINVDRKQQLAWNNKPVVFEIGAKSWQDFILGLPELYSAKSKMKAIIDFGILSNIFTFHNLLKLKRNNIYNKSIYNKYKIYIDRGSQLPNFFLKLIATTPISLRSILKLLYKVILYLDKKN